MLAGVGIICFAGCYTIAFILELSRLWFRSGVRGAVMVAVAAAGVLAHTAYLYYNALAGKGNPLSSPQDWYLIAAWSLAATYLYLLVMQREKSFGLFLLPLILGLIAVGRFGADSEPFAQGPASIFWGVTHGSALLLASVSLLVGFASAVMYLSQASRLKHKLPPRRGFKLPSLEWLQRSATRSLVLATILIGIGAAGGWVLNRIGMKQGAEALGATDPLVLATQLLFLWLVFASCSVLFFHSRGQGRRVAILTIVSFAALLLVMAMMILPWTRHGTERTDTDLESRPAASACLQLPDGGQA